MGSLVRLGLLLFFAVTSSLYSQELPARGDFHTLEDEARRLYSVSAFAHGHRHGYEEGYRVADLEIHFGSRQRELSDSDIPGKMQYQGSFGDKQSFRRGFIRGFLAGYRDSYAHEPFRIPAWLHEVPPFPWTNDLPQGGETPAPPRRLRRSFDEGARSGYEAGWTAPVDDPAASALAGQAGDACNSTPQARKDGFCDGFRQGFLLAIHDRAPVTSPTERPAVAKADSHPH